MIVRLFTPDDYNHIEICINQHKSCYGVKIEHDKLFTRLKYICDNDGIIGAFDDQNECVGICSQWFWKDFPVWTLSNLYLQPTSNLYMNDKQISIIGELMNYGIKLAESRNVYEFYYVIRDTTDGKLRKKIGYDVISDTSAEVASRYEFRNMHIIKTINDVKWNYVRNSIGEIGLAAVKNKKTLIVRRATIREDVQSCVNT